MSKERPIIFNTEMVKAILDGRKTQTRRVIKPQPEINGNHGKWRDSFSYDIETLKQLLIKNKSPYGLPDDLLYVRETWQALEYGSYKPFECRPSEIPEQYADFRYKASEGDVGYTWKPNIHMPKIASRIWLKVKDVRVERVQDIPIQSIPLEGIDIPTYQDSYGYGKRLKEEWIKLWDSINADRGYSFNSNPWCWVVYFEVVSVNGKPERSK